MRTRTAATAFVFIVATILVMSFVPAAAGAAHASQGAGRSTRRTASADVNRDGIPDRWEKQQGLSLRVNQARRDPDRDGLNNKAEFLCRTRPRRADSDRDGVLDGREDPDRDRLNNRAEIAAATNPLAPDSDQDGTADALEDADRDGLNNAQESACGTRPRACDSDRDGVVDANEDRDHDGLDNHDEFCVGCDPADPDSDDDGVLDGDELYGVVVSLDRATGLLVIARTAEVSEGVDEAPLEYVSMTVDGATVMEWADSLDVGCPSTEGGNVRAVQVHPQPPDEGDGPPDGGDGDARTQSGPTIDDLVPGAVVSSAETETKGDGTLRAAKIVLAPYEELSVDDPDMDAGD